MSLSQRLEWIFRTSRNSTSIRQENSAIIFILSYMIHQRICFGFSFAGNAPLVVARGGFSGVFPDSSEFAYNLTRELGLPNVVYWCDVQLTKDGAGICFPDLRLENGSTIDRLPGQENKHNTYLVNGASMQGWFTVDFILDELWNISCKFICLMAFSCSLRWPYLWPHILMCCTIVFAYFGHDG